VNHVVPVKIARNEPETACEKYARKRSSDGDVKFLLGVVGLARDSRQAAEDKKRNGRYGDTVVPCHRAMAELVEDYGRKEKDAGDDSKRPMLSGRPIRVLRGELSAERKRNQEKNDEPTSVQIDGDAKNAS